LNSHFDPPNIDDLEDEIHGGSLRLSGILHESSLLRILVGQLLTVEKGCDERTFADLGVPYNKYFINFHL
jgi:hypothetical protein